MAIQSKGHQDSVKLDLHDKKILFALYQDSRTQRNLLAKKLRISPQNLNYKIQRLENELISPTALLNYPRLGIGFYIFFAEKLDDEAKVKLTESDSLIFFMQTIGRYQYVFGVVSNDIEEFYKKNIPNNQINLYSVNEQIPDCYNPFSIGEVDVPKKNKDLDLDKKDKIILEYLLKKPLDSALEISEKTGMDRKTIKERINRMEEANVIQKFRYAINVFMMGFLIYVLKIEAVPKSRETILAQIRQDKYSGIVFKTHFGFIMLYMPPSHTELFAFTELIEKIDPNTKIDVIQTTENFKINPSPEKIVEGLNRKFN